MEKKLYRNHMAVHWHEMFSGSSSVPATEATLDEKASLVGRTGQIMLSCGTGAYRVRQSMNFCARALHITCSADIGLTSIHFTCFDGTHHSSQTIALATTGVNTDKLMQMEMFVWMFEEKASEYSVEHFHAILDDISAKKGLYKAPAVALGAAAACAGFTFLLGGGIYEMICAFFGAFAGQFLRKKMHERELTLLSCIIASVALALVVYTGCIRLAEAFLGTPAGHEAGFICSMLFVIPGFPLITGGIDIAKLDLRSGIERLLYALLIITAATLTGWVLAWALGMKPNDLMTPKLTILTVSLLRLIMSFISVFGFSMLFNSPPKIAASAGVVGMIANTLRLFLVDETAIPFSVAAFIGALTAGLLASLVKKQTGFPRISLTVPSIVIMVPGLFMYRAVYYIGGMNLQDGTPWLVKAVLIVLALPLGLVCARILTDASFRHCS